MSLLAVARNCLALALLASAGPSVHAEGAARLPEIEYVAPDQSVWTIRTDRHGQPENPLFPVAEALFARAGIPWHGRSYPAARMFKYLQDGSAQFSMLVKAPALNDCCLFSRKPIAVAEIRVFHLGGQPAVAKLDDLAGKSIITIHGYSYGGLLAFVNDGRNRVSNNLALTHSAAFKMLAQRRADYVIDYARPAAEVLAETPLTGLQSSVLSRQEVHLVLHKSYPDAPAVLARLEAIADTLDVDRIMRTTKK
ncbi:MAG TPA: hypothetical protein VF096_16555 [Azonexus sp.]